MEIPDIRFWAGTEECFAAYISCLKTAAGLDIQAYHDREDEAGALPRLLTKQGNVGVVSIAGPLMPGNPWYARYVGATGYGEIREALVAAAQDPDIGAILLDVNSGGGAVSGVTDVAELIANIDKNVKPVQTFSDGMIASAAYWTGGSGRRIDVGKVTEAGSVGVITVHKEMAKMFEKAGITVTVMRAGEFKALGNSMEALDDKAKAEIQGQLDQVYAMFVQHVADSRGVSYQLADSKMAQGRVFIGQSAVDVGLVDGVSNFDAVISKMQGEIDSQKSRSQYGGNFHKGAVVKTALTEQELAALAQGAGTVASLPVVEDGKPVVPVVQTTTPAAETKPATDVVKPAAEESKPNELVTYLQTQLSASQAQASELTAQVKDLTASAEKSKGLMASMRTIVEASTKNLQIALNTAVTAASSLSDEVLLAQHASLCADFDKKFKAGGVAAASSSGSSEKSAEVDDPNRLERIKATRLTN